MRERIEQLVAAFEASLDDGSVTPESFQRAVAEIGALEPITEPDRLCHLTGTVRLLDALLNRLARDEGESSREQRARIAGVVERQFSGSNAPYARSRDIVQEVATKLKGGDNADAAVSAAIAELNGLAFDEAEVAEIARSKNR
jgi:hypothetical protein